MRRDAVLEQLRLASPVDPVARAQAGRVCALLETRPDTPAPAMMIFENPPHAADLAECLAVRLLAGDADAAVCPADRLRSRIPEGVVVAALLRDRRAAYRCVGAQQRSLAEMPPGAKVAVCDRVARAQILHAWPHLRVELVPASAEMLDRLRDRAWDAACLPSELLETGSLSGLRYDPAAAEDLMPAVGLGVTAILVRRDRTDVRSLVKQLDDPEVAMLLDVERAFLAQAPVEGGSISTARAERREDVIQVTGLVADEEGRWLVRDEASASERFGRLIAREVADSCAALARRQRDRIIELKTASSF